MPTESVEANQTLKKGGSALAGLRIEEFKAVRAAERFAELILGLKQRAAFRVDAIA